MTNFVRTGVRSYTNLDFDANDPVCAAADTVLFLDDSARPAEVLALVLESLAKILAADPHPDLIIADSWDAPPRSVRIITLRHDYNRDTGAIHPEFARFEEALHCVRAAAAVLPLGIFTSTEWWVGFLQEGA